MPKINIMKKKDLLLLEKRKRALNFFLKQICEIKEIITSPKI